MARGQQKIQAQQKRAEKMAKSKKPTTQRGAAEAAMNFQCTICKVRACPACLLHLALAHAACL
jgi:hypothetical protein